MAAFEGQLSLHDTELTRAIDTGDFICAEKIIAECTEPQYLNEGAFGVLPLHLVLRGGHLPVHLHLAQVLLDHGAYPGTPMPDADGSDFSMSGQTPLSLLVQYYIKAYQCRLCDTESWERFLKKHPVICMKQTTDPSYKELKKQLLLLLHLFMAQNINTGLDQIDNEPLLNIVMARCPDVDLLEALYTHNIVFTIRDIHSNTPIHQLCSHRSWQAERHQALEFIIHRVQLEDEFLDNRNCGFQSSLWLSMYYGLWKLAATLMNNGCDVVNALGWICKYNTPNEPSDHIDGFEAALTLREKNCTIDSVYRGISLLVDQGCFDTYHKKHIAPLFLRSHHGFKNVEQLKENKEVQTHPERLLATTFGHFSAGLKQQCVRAVMKQVWTVEGRFVPQFSPDLHEKGLSCLSFLSYLDDFITTENVEGLLDKLGLPYRFTLNFQLELLRWYMMMDYYDKIRTVCGGWCVESVETESESSNDDSDSLDIAYEDVFMRN